MKATYTVIYRTGGPARFQWREVLDRFSKDAAEAKAAEIKRQGYHAEVRTLDSLRHGLPESWDAASPIPGNV